MRDIVFIRLCKPDCIIMGFVYVTPKNQICQRNSWTLVKVDAFTIVHVVIDDLALFFIYISVDIMM